MTDEEIHDLDRRLLTLEIETKNLAIKVDDKFAGLEQTLHDGFERVESQQSQNAARLWKIGLTIAAIAGALGIGGSIGLGAIGG